MTLKFLTFIFLFSSTELPTEEGKCRTWLSVTCTDFGPHTNDDNGGKLFRQAVLERIWKRWRWHFCWHIFFILSLASWHLKNHSFGLEAWCYIIYCCCNKNWNGSKQHTYALCSLWFQTICLFTDNKYERRKMENNARSETNDTTIQYSVVIIAVFLSHHTRGSRPSGVVEIYLTGEDPHTELNLNTQVNFSLLHSSVSSVDWIVYEQEAKILSIAQL